MKRILLNISLFDRKSKERSQLYITIIPCMCSHRNGPEWRRLRSAIHPLLRREVVNAYRSPQTEVANDLVRVVASNNQGNAKQDAVNPSRYVIPDLLSILFHYTLEGECEGYLGVRGSRLHHLLR